MREDRVIDWCEYSLRGSHRTWWQKLLDFVRHRDEYIHEAIGRNRKSLELRRGENTPRPREE